MKRMSLVVIALGVCLSAALLPRIPQDPAYHHMADRRTFAGVPNAADVLSNLPFALVGGIGLVTVIGSSTRSNGGRSWIVFFAATAATTAGSIYYHLSPSDDRVLWDRLPMSIAFASLLAAVIGERVSARAGRLLLLPLTIAAAGSVVFWYWSELAGRGDLRPYACVQFGSLVVLVAILFLYPDPRSETRWLVGGLSGYAIAKVFESADLGIYSLTHGVSGHTLKHLAAAAAVGCVIAMFRARHFDAGYWRLPRRGPLGDPQEC